MYEYVEGTLQAIGSEVAIVSVGGLGFRIMIAKTSALRTLPLGHTVKLFVDLVVREDSHTLFGFESSEERDFFRLLQQVNGIGPKASLNILGHSKAGEMAEILFKKDTKTLSTIPGIGKKLAERLVVELHEKAQEWMSTVDCRPTPTLSIALESQQALQTLGFSAQEAKKAVAEALQKDPSLNSSEQLIRYVLSTHKPSGKRS